MMMHGLANFKFLISISESITLIGFRLIFHLCSVN